MVREVAPARLACQLPLALMWLPAALQLARGSRQLQQMTLPQATAKLARLRSQPSQANAHLADQYLMPPIRISMHAQLEAATDYDVSGSSVRSGEVQA